MAEETQHEFIIIPDTKAELLTYLRKKVAKNGNINKREKLNFKSHPGIHSAYNALNMNRSPKTSFIYLLGVTGSGKSSTINFLFDKEICQTGSETSITTDTIEYTSMIKDSRLFIKNLSISVIDGPGLEDTGGIRNDTKNILCHQRFLETHPQLASVKPNVVMITLKITDDRLGDDKNTDTPFARMLKAIKKFLGPKLIDAQHPNVIFVLTNFHSFTRKRVQELLPMRIKTIKILSAKCLGVPDPPVVATENCPGEYDDLKKDEHGWYHLRNGDKHPLTLFSALINLCKRTDDLIGQEVISKYFSQERKATIIEQGHKINSNEVKEDDRFNRIENEFGKIRLDVRESDILTKLEEKFNELPKEEKEFLSPLTPTNVTSFLQFNNITSCKDIPQDKAFLELFANYSERSTDLLIFLENALDIKIEKIRVDTKVGSCFDVMKDSILGTSIYELSGETKLTWHGFQIPDEVDIYPENLTFSRCEQLSSIEEYMRKRLADLSVNADISFIGSNVSIRNGYSVSSSSSQNVSKKTLLIEHHCFKVTIDEDKLKLSDRFRCDVNELPDSYENNNEANVSRWKGFFDKYGTHVVKTAWGGGACAATVTVASSNCSEEELHQLMVHIEHQLSGADFNLTYEAETTTKIEKLFNTSSIHMEGGNPNYHVTNLKALTSDNTKKWLASTLYKPSILTTKLELIPISYVVGTYRTDIRDEFSRVYKDLFGASLKYKPESKKTIEPEEMSATSREDATKKTAPDASSKSCITGGTMILMADSSERPVEQLKPGDLIVDKDGKNRKVLGINQVLLGNRSLYGFEPYTEPFFTSEHLFAGENNEWVCMDPCEAKRLNPQFTEMEILKMKTNCKVLKWNGHAREIKSVIISCNNFLPSSTMVYCLIVEAGTYIANGFVTKDSMPDLLAWPSSAICLASLLSSDNAQLLHQHIPVIDSIESSNSIEILALKIALTWNDILLMHNHIKPLGKYDQVNITYWMEKLTNITSITSDEFSFITMILSKPSLTYLAQRLYISCGKNVQNTLEIYLKNDSKKFVTIADQLYRSGESIIGHYVNQIIEEM